MNKLTTIETDLDKARKELAELSAELPQFYSLLTDNERDAQRLKTERASLDAQSQARGRIQIAKEMLEQHQSDIATAHSEVARLEALKRRELLLAKMHTAADTAKAHRASMDKALAHVTQTLQRDCETILREWTAEFEARQVFAQVGTELVPGFSSLSEPAHAGMTNEQRLRFEADRAALLDELAERGAPLDEATDGATGRHSSLDKYAKQELPRDELSMLIWAAFKLLAGPAAQGMTRFLPTRPSGVTIPAYLTSSDPYRL
jgi:DNA repair exonuclease SbcCD ATPase subunit